MTDLPDKQSSNHKLEQEWNEHITVFSALEPLLPLLQQAGELMITSLAKGHKILLAGNGGSAADAQHIAAELVGRYSTERVALAAIALTTDTSIMTAVSNDYGYDMVFARQIEALADEGDVLLAYSTSGNSGNVCNAVKLARQKKVQIISLTGASGGALLELSNINLAVPSESTPRIQECHAFMGHMLCQMVDDAVANGRIPC